MGFERHLQFLPDHPPTWLDILMGVFTLWLSSSVQTRVVAWPWFLAGTAVTLLTLGPFKHTSLGRRIDEHDDDASGVRKLAIVVLIAGVLWGLILLLEIPVPIATSGVAGAMAGVSVFVFVHLASARSVDGLVRRER
ncbi:hypothetical protein [Halomicrobium sp. LC1Hm]|uniref:hypothetical protein n=1 Tax=Halomicrobium sp. LC1Hm TaxID=2610902 RepID=UPI001298416B|nr:hypothetical protein [Halomicrobium sp. LC1Hm]QGA83312.1 hypothetical protein LC1Hm_2278 [Halomicrobium sp. LC1Hm]